MKSDSTVEVKKRRKFTIQEKETIEMWFNEWLFSDEQEVQVFLALNHSQFQIS